jgi:hypothetical protein
MALSWWRRTHMGHQGNIPARAIPLHYAPAYLPRPKVKPPLGLAFAGTLLNYFAACAVAAWSDLIIDHIVAANGREVVWSKLGAFDHQAIDVPAAVGFSCTFILTCLFTVLIIRRRAGFWLILGFILINLFAIVFMLVSLDMGALEHGLYP